MLFREAKPADIPQMQIVRNSVKENILSDPRLVTNETCHQYITHLGKGWVAESESVVVAFAIADLAGNNIWALFVDPRFEKRGIGKQLHQLMLDWYFSQTNSAVWLSTTLRSRAEQFYRIAGWQEIGLYGKGEIKFVMTKEMWQLKRRFIST